mgnify:CR=1 FL=1
MGAIGYSEGKEAPAMITKEIGHRYKWLQDGKIDRQNGPGGSNAWVEEAALVDYKTDVETETGESLNGEKIYQVYLQGEGFPNPGGYTLIPHGIAAPFRVVEVSGWCDYAPGSTANMYATYFDGLGNIRSSWTSANPDKPWRITIKYLKG